MERDARTGSNKLWAAGGPGFSSTTDDWATPPHVFAALDSEFSFALDACASADNAKCDRFYTAAEDGLFQPWAPATTWMNPPYGRAIGEWMQKAADEAEGGATVVCLVPARTDTKWWHEQVMARASQVRFVRGRLKFGSGAAPAPFPSAVVVYQPGAPMFSATTWTPPTPSTCRASVAATTTEHEAANTPQRRRMRDEPQSRPPSRGTPGADGEPR